MNEPMLFENLIVFHEAKEQQWKIGQVSKLFGVSVQTLRYYDEIGIFSPYRRDELTGYRYYLQSQIYRLANIIYLSKQGYSLAETKNYLDNLTFGRKTAGLKMQSEAIEREVERLRFISRAIKQKISYIERNDYLEKKDNIEIIDVSSRNYIEIGPEKDLYASEIFYFFPTIVIYYPDKKIFGACIRDKKDFRSYASLLSESSKLERNIKTIPAGKVLRGYYEGPYETIRKKIIEMIAFSMKKGMQLADHSVHYNIIDQFVEGDPGRYVTEIRIPLS